MQLLSHYLSSNTPTYGNNPDDLVFEDASCISCGDSANSMKITLKNHVGTHIDLPKHFDDSGKILRDYEMSQFVFQNVQLVDLPCEEEQLISVQDLEGKINDDVELLIIRTGFEQKRGEKKYWNNNPGVNLGVGEWLRKNFPKLRCIGFDFISLSCYQQREIGRQAHREFLSQACEGEPIWIIEDMKLANININEKSRIIVAPLLVEKADGVPVTVLLES